MKPKGLLACWLVGLVGSRPVVLTASRGFFLFICNRNETQTEQNSARSS